MMERNQYAEALRLYLSLAERFRSVTAYLNIGWIYQKGLDVEIDLDKAAFWFQKASSAGSKEGSFYLASLYYTQKKCSDAEKILQSLAERDYAPACYRLSKIYRSENGDESKSKIAEYYRYKALELGHLAAKRDFAVDCMKGKYGLRSMWRGVVLFVGTLESAWKVAKEDPYSDLLQR